MHDAGEAGLAEGAAIARELIAKARGAVQGIYLIPAFNRYDLAEELVRELKGEPVTTEVGR
jgi:homocysteine S-methyltransferase